MSDTADPRSGLDATKRAMFDSLIVQDDPDDTFELIEKLGRGSHGVVYKALNRVTGETIAVKKLLHVAEKDLEDTLKEISILNSLNSPHCIRYYSSHYKNGDLWIAMEFLDAGSIGDLLCFKKKLNEPQIRMIVFQVTKGLEYLHSLPLIHRDIKAGNILLNKKGQVKLADFGVSALMESDAAKHQTQIGSPFWMAPELIQGEGYNVLVDIWSLGMTILEMTDFEHPFFECNPLSAVFTIVSKPPPTVLDPSAWSDDFLDFMSLCLTKDPNKRPSATQLLAHPFLAPYVQASAPSAAAPPSPKPSPAKKKPANLKASQGLPRWSSSEAGGTKSAPVPDVYYSHPTTGSPHAPRHRQNPIASESQLIGGKALAEDVSTARSIHLQNTQQGLTADGQRKQTIEDEMLLRLFMADNSYRTLVVYRGEKCCDVHDRLCAKLGLAEQDWDYYGIYLYANENEREIDEHVNMLELVHSRGPSAKLLWKMKPDRQAFADMSSVLNDIPDLKTFNYARDRQVIKSFVVTIMAPRLSVLTALLANCGKQKKKMYRNVVTLFGHFDRLSYLFSTLFSRELSWAVSMRDLFHHGSLAGGLVSTYGDMVARPFLKRVVAPTIAPLLTLVEPLDIDSRNVTQEKAFNNMMILQDACDSLLRLMNDNICHLPKGYREACKLMEDLALRSFPRTGMHIHCCLIFWKLVCPAIVAPYEYGVIDSPSLSPFARKALVSLSKTVGALGSQSTWRQVNMIGVQKAFVKDRMKVMESLLSSICNYKDPEEEKPSMTLSVPEIEACVGYFFDIFSDPNRIISLGQEMEVLPKMPLD